MLGWSKCKTSELDGTLKSEGGGLMVCTIVQWCVVPSLMVTGGSLNPSGQNKICKKSLFAYRMERFDWMCLQLHVPLFFIFLSAYMIITVDGNNYIDDYIVWCHTYHIFSTTRLWCDHRSVFGIQQDTKPLDFGITIWLWSHHRHEYSIEVYGSRSKVNWSNCKSHHVHALIVKFNKIIKEFV